MLRFLFLIFFLCSLGKAFLLEAQNLANGDEIYFSPISKSAQDNSLEPFENNVYLSRNVKLFLDEIFVILEGNALHKDSIDWETVRAKTFKIANFSTHSSQAVSAVNYALSQLKEEKRHTRIINSPKKAKISKDSETDSDIKKRIEVKSLSEQFVYIKLPSVKSMNLFFAQELQNQIKKHDSKKIKGWIVDLRDNPGGSCWPMLLGLGPLLDEGILGFFGRENHPEMPWSYFGGKLQLSHSQLLLELEHPYTLKNPQPYIALLIDKTTMSAAEIVSVSFKSQKKVKQFGSHTGGYSTGVVTHHLSNGMKLALAEAFCYDRERNLYKMGIPA